MIVVVGGAGECQKNGQQSCGGKGPRSSMMGGRKVRKREGREKKGKRGRGKRKIRFLSLNPEFIARRVFFKKIEITSCVVQSLKT